MVGGGAGGWAGGVGRVQAKSLNSDTRPSISSLYSTICLAGFGVGSHKSSYAVYDVNRCARTVGMRQLNYRSLTCQVFPSYTHSKAYTDYMSEAPRRALRRPRNKLQGVIDILGPHRIRSWQGSMLRIPPQEISRWESSQL